MSQVNVTWNSRAKYYTVRQGRKVVLQTTYAVLTDVEFISRGTSGTIRGIISNEKPNMEKFKKKLDFTKTGFSYQGAQIKEAPETLIYNGSAYIS